MACCIEVARQDYVAGNIAYDGFEGAGTGQTLGGGIHAQNSCCGRSGDQAGRCLRVLLLRWRTGERHR